jgi:uncharacterized protein with HEPN domain
MPHDVDGSAALDICEAARKVEEFLAGDDAAAFLGDSKTQSAVVLQLLIVGEAAKRLSSEFRARHPSVPWSQIMRMRDKLIHHYEEWDVELIWQVTQGDLPRLRQALERTLPEEPR